MRFRNRSSVWLLSAAAAIVAVAAGCVPYAAPVPKPGTSPTSATTTTSTVTATPTSTPTVTGPPAAFDTKTVCAYSDNSIEKLAAFGTLVGRDFDCALVFNNWNPDWAHWAQPWFTVHGNTDLNWATWVRAAPGRLLVISQSLIPNAAAPADWRQRGAAGEYDGYARSLATNLVAAGLGRAVIRLAPEANGDWNFDSIGTTTADIDAWRAYWARVASVMRSVPGAAFEFDWTVNSAWPRIPFASYYPGDAAVDLIGIDDYDAPVDPTMSPDQRWTLHYGQRFGLAELLAFAASHAKAASIPEWGLWNPTKSGAGDDPAFVDGIASVVRSNVIRYSSYFESATGQDNVVPLTAAPLSVPAYNRHFGAGGDATRDGQR